MGFFDAYRQQRAALSAPESVATLSYMEEYLQGGNNWTQGVYRQGDARCLVAAAEYARVSSIDDAKHWLRQAIAERTSGAVTTIEEFNDRQDFFGEIEAVITRAKQLAAANLSAPVKVIPPVRAATANQEQPTPVGIGVDYVPDRSIRRKLADWMFD